MKQQLAGLLALVLVLPLAAADLKVKQRASFSVTGAPMDINRTMENTTLFHDDFVRAESTPSSSGSDSAKGGNLQAGGPMGAGMMGSGMITIRNCSTGQMTLISPAKKMFAVIDRPMGAMRSNPPGNRPDRGPGEADENAVTDINTVDTGETKQIAGHPAHHYVTTVKRARQGEFPNLEMTIDSWNLTDVTVPNPACAAGSGGGPGSGMGPMRGIMDGQSLMFGGLQARGKVNRTGVEAKGFPAQLNVKGHNSITDRDGNVREIGFTADTVATEISTAPLDPALFKPPDGYKQAKDARELMPMGGFGGMHGGMRSDSQAPPQN